MDKIGKYDLIRALGKGATSTVYLGVDAFAQRQVAVKIASPEVLKDPARGRLYKHLFLNEASLVGKLSHPHITQIYDAAIDDSLCYIVMEYVQGGTLETYASPEKLLPVERIVEIIFKCTRALDFAYGIGITHRDIKPANILFAGDSAASGDIKISDFGAAIIDSLDNTQVSGIGSPAYMSPEQVQELPLDYRTDIYSLGVVMYQLLCGRLPFQANNKYNMIYQIINADPKPPSHYRAGIPAGIDEITMRAMARDADNRYPSWRDFSNALAQAFRNKTLPLTKRNLTETEQFETMREIAFFAAFSDVEIWEVLRFATWETVRAGKTIIRDGEHGDFFGFLISGELKIIKHGRILNLMTNGDCFGEMAAISSEKIRTADVVALTETQVVIIRGEILSQASETCRMHFYQAFLSVMVTRLALSSARLAAR